MCGGQSRFQQENVIFCQKLGNLTYDIWSQEETTEWKILQVWWQTDIVIDSVNMLDVNVATLQTFESEVKNIKKEDIGGFKSIHKKLGPEEQNSVASLVTQSRFGAQSRGREIKALRQWLESTQQFGTKVLVQNCLRSPSSWLNSSSPSAYLVPLSSNWCWTHYPRRLPDVQTHWRRGLTWK